MKKSLLILSATLTNLVLMTSCHLFSSETKQPEIVSNPTPDSTKVETIKTVDTNTVIAKITADSTKIDSLISE